MYGSFIYECILKSNQRIMVVLNAIPKRVLPTLKITLLLRVKMVRTKQLCSLNRNSTLIEATQDRETSVSFFRRLVIWVNWQFTGRWLVASNWIKEGVFDWRLDDLQISWLRWRGINFSFQKIYGWILKHFG